MTTVVTHTADPVQFVVSASFTKVGKQYYFDYTPYPSLAVGDYIIVESQRLGQQLGQVKGFKLREELESAPIYPLLRPATPADLLTKQQWQEKEIAVLIDCREKAAELGGYKNVKFVAADYNYNGTMLTFYFTVGGEDNRVNTHRLRVALQKQLNTRIEFRQVGPRDVAKLQAGLGACGIPRCCSTFLTDFSMVSVAMAKAQGISLNPTEITGMCGRLRCCLTYEYEQYIEARKQLPAYQKRVGTPHGEGRVVEVHPMADAVTVLVNDEQHLVKREDLIPLDEHDALREAAASPCSKNAGGGCDCGAKRPRGSAEELMAEMGVVPTAPAEEIQSAGVRAAQEAARAERSARNEQSRRGGQQRRRGGRNRRRGGQKTSNEGKNKGDGA